MTGKARQIRRRAQVSGRVQGVFFRASTAEKASALGLVGWVRNEADGTVRLEVQGAAAAVEALLAWCADGPPAANVTRVAVEDVATVDDETEFSIVRRA